MNKFNYTIVQRFIDYETQTGYTKEIATAINKSLAEIIVKSLKKEFDGNIETPDISFEIIEL